MAGLDLDNDQGAVLQPDNIGFKSFAIPIAFKNDQPASFKVPGGYPFTPYARGPL